MKLVFNNYKKILLKYWSDLDEDGKKSFLINLAYNKCAFLNIPKPYLSIDDYINSLDEETLDIIYLEVVKNV